MRATDGDCVARNPRCAGNSLADLGGQVGGNPRQVAGDHRRPRLAVAKHQRLRLERVLRSRRQPLVVIPRHRKAHRGSDLHLGGPDPQLGPGDRLSSHRRGHAHHARDSHPNQPSPADQPPLPTWGDSNPLLIDWHRRDVLCEREKLRQPVRKESSRRQPPPPARHLPTRHHPGAVSRSAASTATSRQSQLRPGQPTRSPLSRRRERLADSEGRLSARLIRDSGTRLFHPK